MQVNQRTDQFLHHKLPIDPDEKILGVYRHHWFAYASTWVVAIILVIIIFGLAAFFTVPADGLLAEHRVPVVAVAAGVSVLVLMGAAVPAYLRSQEQLVLTEEALLQVLQPSLFASKVDQVNLQRMDDISVRQDFLGTILGYGHLSIETPGEQDNYEFLMLPHAHDTAREITNAHENYVAAVQSGRMPSTLGTPEPPTPQIDPQQYQEFLAYQQMVRQQQAQQASPPPQAVPPAAPEQAPPQQPSAPNPRPEAPQSQPPEQNQQSQQ